MDLQSLGTLIGILSGLVTLLGAVVGAYDRLHERAHGARAPVLAGSYPPPASNVSGPYPQPTPSGATPPPNYRWPAGSPPGAAQPGQPPVGAPAPHPGYGAPAGQWNNAPQPGTPYPTPHQLPYPPYPHYAPQPVRRTLRSRLAPPGSSRWFPYPVVLIGTATYFLLSGILGVVSGGADSTNTTASDPLTLFFTLLIIAAYIATVVHAARQAVRLRRWGWLISIIFLAFYGMAAFGIFGPTTPPRSKAPSGYPPYPPYPPRRV